MKGVCGICSVPALHAASLFFSPSLSHRDNWISRLCGFSIKKGLKNCQRRGIISSGPAGCVSFPVQPCLTSHQKACPPGLPAWPACLPASQTLPPSTTHSHWDAVSELLGGGVAMLLCCKGHGVEYGHSLGRTHQFWAVVQLPGTTHARARTHALPSILSVACHSEHTHVAILKGCKGPGEA